MTVVETRSVTATDGEEIVVEVIKAMAAAKDVPCTALDIVLSDVVDTDSLARLFECNQEAAPGCVAVTVSIDGFHVSLRRGASEQVTIEVTQPAPRTSASDEVPPTAATDVETSL